LYDFADTGFITFIKFEYDICRNQGAEFDSIFNKLVLNSKTSRLYREFCDIEDFQDYTEEKVGQESGQLANFFPSNSNHH